MPGLDVDLQVHEGVPLGEATRIAVVRCAQEIVTNTLRHAGASRLELLVASDHDGLPYLRSAMAGEDAPAARAFLVRRAARVVPLYLVAVSLVWAFRNQDLPGDWVDLVEHLTFTQVFDNQRIFYTIGPAWSLAVEVQFYLVLAVLGKLACHVCRRLPPPRRRSVLAAGLAGIVLFSVIWKAVA